MSPHRARIDRFANDLITRLENSASRIEKEITTFKAALSPDLSPTDQKKAFAQFLSAFDRLAQPVYWKVWRGQEARECVLGHVLKNVERHLAELSGIFAEGTRFSQYTKSEDECVAQRSFSDWH